MKKSQIFFIVGVWIAVLPYLGFPYSWKEVLFSLTGLGIIVFNYLVNKEDKINNEKSFDNFKENNNFNEPNI